jgi:hypothetical protein
MPRSTYNNFFKVVVMFQQQDVKGHADTPASLLH